jgi:NAD(P) transhydrogenase
VSTEDSFDMVVIGSGPAGEKAAAQAAYFGRRVAVVEQSHVPGGAAVGNASIPSKTLRETAMYITGFRRRNVYGLSLTLDPEATLAQLRTRTAQVIETMTDAVRVNLNATQSSSSTDARRSDQIAPSTWPSMAVTSGCFTATSS